LFPHLVFIGSLTAIDVCITYMLLQKRCLWLFVVLALLCIPYIWGFFVQKKVNTIADHGTFVYAQPPAYNKDMVAVDPLELAHAITEQLRHALRKFPQAHVIFFPESTFPFP